MPRLLILALLLVAQGLGQTERQEQRQEERREERQEQRQRQRRSERRRQRRAGQQPVPQPTSTHPWDGILDPSRAIDWTHAGIPGGIPNVTNVCTQAVAGVPIPIQPSGDTSGATDGVTINNVLSACGATATAANPIVVTLAAGTFYTNNGITFGNPAKNYTVLRGAGPDKTIIVSPNDTAIGCGQFGYMCIYGSAANKLGSNAGQTTWLGTNNVIGTYTQGATVLNVGSTTGMVASPPGATNIGQSGTIINLDQRADAIGICPSQILGGGTGPCAGVDGATESGTTVTIHTSLPLATAFQGGLNVGDCVGVSGVGPTFNVSNVVWNTGPTMTYTIGANTLTAGAWNPIVVWGNSALTIAGVTPTQYNGTYNVSATTSTTVTVSGFGVPATNPGTFVSGGTAYSNQYLYSSDFNQSVSCTDATGIPKPGFFSVTSVPTSTSFTYALPAANTGLAPGASAAAGAAQVGKDTGGVMFNAVVGPFSNEGGNSGRNCPNTINNPPTCATGEISRRDPNEIKRVVDICTAGGTWQIAGTACTVNSIMIDPPVEMPMWRTSQSPGVYWWGNYAVGVGIEALTLDTSPGTYSSSLGGIIIQNAYRSWVRNVRTINGNRNHVWIQNGFQLTLRDNYFFGVKGSGTQSYGIEDWSSDSLKENNICQHVISCEMVAYDYGGVWAYNYAVDCPWGAASLSSQDCARINHDFSAMVLEEGDNVSYVQSDNIHGMSYGLTAFRNRYRNQDTPWKYNAMSGHYSSAYTRGNNVVNSVIGTRKNEVSYYSKWNTFDGKTTYNIGYQGENFQVPPDPLVGKILLRWGNYDVCSDSADTTTPQSGNDPGPIVSCTSAPGANGIRFCGGSSDTGWTTTCNSTSEIPTTGTTFINPNPIPTKGDTGAGQGAFPVSFFLSAAPDFWQTAWGTPGWPAIGSDVTASGALDATCATPPVIGFSSTTCDGVAHHSYQTPAQICFNNSPIDPAGTGYAGQAQQAYPISSPITSAIVGNALQYTVPLPSGHVIPQCTAYPNSGNTCMSVVTITGVNPPQYNGTWMASMVTATSFSFIRPDSTWALPAYVSGGTVNWPNVRLFNAASCYPVAYGGSPPVVTTPPSIINGNGKITGQGKIT